MIARRSGYMFWPFNRSAKIPIRLLVSITFHNLETFRIVPSSAPLFVTRSHAEILLMFTALNIHIIITSSTRPLSSYLGYTSVHSQSGMSSPSADELSAAHILFTMAHGQDAKNKHDLPILSDPAQSSVEDRAGTTKKRNRGNIEDTTEMAQCATSLIQLASDKSAAVPKTLAQNVQLQADAPRSLPRRSAAKVPTRSHQVFPILDALCAHPEVILYLTTQHLDPATMLTLYSISRRFHYSVSYTHLTLPTKRIV